MKTVNDDPYEFFKEGGWGFLSEKDAVSFPFVLFAASPTRAHVFSR